MNEMAVTAEHLIVIGRGKVIADCTTKEFIEQSSEKSVLVKSPDAARLREVLVTEGAAVDPDGDGAVNVRHLEAARIGELAAREGLILHELTPQRASLEAAFMELTRDSVEYGQHGPVHGHTAPPARGHHKGGEQ
jgi:ABC-2 type transport system ATP-binding protein